MFKLIGDLWTQHALGHKLYVGYAIIVAVVIVVCVCSNLKNNPRKKMSFIAKAQKNKCFTVGKLTCATLHGYKTPDFYQVEYMYVVNDKRHFVTYQIRYQRTNDDRIDCMNADVLLAKIKPAIILFYDQNDPSKVLCKQEVFCSYDGIHKVKTPKENVYRDVEKDWVESIDLITY